MLIGHYAPAFLLKARTPTLPLWVFFVAVEVLDYLWSGFVLVGLEHFRISPGINASNALDLYDMPLSHSLLATGVWSLLAGAVVWVWQRGKPALTWSAVAVALAVVSHFALDLVVHVNDLPLAGSGSPRLGLGLWNSRPLALLVETSLFVGAVLVLGLQRGWKTSRSFWVLGVAMAAFCAASFFIPTPATTVEMALSGLALYCVLPPLAWWVERQGAPVTSGTPEPSPSR